MSYDPEKQILENREALDNPKVGDYWQEMFCPYFLVVDVRGKDITVLSCLGGPDSYNRKDELNARVEVDSQHWRFDPSKSMVVDRAWMAKAVKYGSIDGFVADVINSEKSRGIAAEWRDWKQKQMRRAIDDMERQWQDFTGWTALKETN